MTKKAFFFYLISFLFLACGHKNNSTEKPYEKPYVDSVAVIDSGTEVLYEKLDTKPTIAIIDSDSDTIIECDKGTLVFIEANSLVLKDGTKPDSLIQISVREYYSKADIASQPLTTLDENGLLLVSGGMINIEASSGNDSLRLMDGKEIIVHFPKNGNTRKMKMFSGLKDNQGNVIWKKEETDKYTLKDSLVIWYTKYENLDDSSLYQANGKSIYYWIEEEMKLTPSEQNYFLYKDIDLHYAVTKVGDIVNIRFKKDIRSSIANKYVKILESAPKCKPYTVNGEPIDMPGYIKFNVKVVPPDYSRKSSYLNAIKAKALKRSDRSMNSFNKLELHYFIFNSKNLGYINCDDFVNEPAPKVNIVVKVEDAVDDMVKFIYKDLNSVLAGNYENNQYAFNNVPKGKEVTLIVIRYKRGKALVDFKHFVTDDLVIEDINLREMTMGELKNELEKLN